MLMDWWFFYGSFAVKMNSYELTLYFCENIHDLPQSVSSRNRALLFLKPPKITPLFIKPCFLM